MLAARAEEAARLGSWELDIATGDLAWSDNMYRLRGLEVGEIEPTLEYLFSNVHVDDRESLEEFVAEVRRGADLPPFEYRYLLGSGEVRCLRVTLSITERDGSKPVRAIGSVQDVTEWRQAEREVQAHLAVPRALRGWISLVECGDTLLAELARPFDAPVGAIWIPRDGLLEQSNLWMSATLDGAADYFRTASEESRLPRGAGLPGRAWERCRPVSRDTHDQVDYHRRAAVEELELRGGFAFPVFVTEPVMVVELMTRERMALTESLELTLRAIGHEIGQFMLRRRVEMEPSSVTPREIEVLRLAAGGLTGPEIAGHLVVSPATVKSHFENIYPKLEVNDRAAAVATALRIGLID